MDANAGLCGLFAALSSAKSVTITAPSELDCHLVRLNAALLAGQHQRSGSGGGYVGRRQRCVVQMLGTSTSIYVYTLSASAAGADSLIRQWQWDSGTAMRALQPALVAPHFDVILHAGWSDSSDARAAEGLLDLAQKLLAPNGALLVAGPCLCRPMARLAELVQEAARGCFRLESDELHHCAHEQLTLRLLRVRVGGAARGAA
eukprot:TRINITY_DN91719_c0_g1_i1.p1 TRINITY_DN91719_c0_g1~~TRINITY_DN91719_c0_g1_i1.p1  ORF type:complete len:203 (-),score=47.10 TRINITY_DN91719_c0_g1_i1:164-772(-)